MEQLDAFEYAKQRMNQRFLAGEKEEAALIDQVAKTVIVDRLVPPISMTFCEDSSANLSIKYADLKQVRIHPHAFNQLCQKVSFPMTFARALDGDLLWRRELLQHSLNELYKKEGWPVGTRFLHRIVGDELRGALSRRYNRHLASLPLLRTFVDACRKGGARPINATTTPVRIALSYLLPNVFEAFTSENVCFGTTFGNSDFGAGRLSICSTVWRVNSGSLSTLDQAFAKVHIGSVLEDDDLLELSEDTAKKEVEAQRGVISDCVKQQLKEETVDRLLQAIRLARDEKIPWSKLSGQLSKFLSKADVEWAKNILEGKGETITELPPISFEPDGTRVANAYWAAAAVGAIASRTEDADKKLDLQKEAGKLLLAAAA